MTDPVLLRVHEGVARLTLNRPDRLNAFDAEAAQLWADRAAAAAADPAARAILVHGRGRALCAGGDVRAMAEMSDRQQHLTSLARTITAGMTALLEAPKPVVVAAHGTTAGGGLGILLASDYTIVGAGSRIGSRYAAVGLSPDLTVSALLGRAVGERRALQLALSDRMLSGAEAVDWGLAAEVVDDERVVERAEQIAAEWADGASQAYAEAKRLLRQAPQRPFLEQVEDEARTIGRLSVTAEADRRIRAFADRAGTA